MFPAQEISKNTGTYPRHSALTSNQERFWFVKECSQIRSSEIVQWIRTTAEGSNFFKVASQHYFAKKCLRCKEITVKRKDFGEPLGVHLSSIFVSPFLEAMRKTYLRVEDCLG